MGRRLLLLGVLLGVWTGIAAVVPVPVATGYSSGGYYRYCPATVVEDGVRHVFYCRNRSSNRVVDAIYHAVQAADGTLSGEAEVLAPADSTGTAWDSYHVCDPSVVSGAFVHNGHAYRYLMAYLGVKGRPGDGSSDGARSINNKVGLAVSDSLSGGWVRMGAAPVVETEHPDWWGVGQPSLVSLDGAGRVALFYAGDYETRMLELDFSGAAATTASLATRKGGDGTFVGKTGVSDLARTTTAMTITNGDFAYDAAQGYLYLVADTPDAAGGWYDAGGQNLYITKAVTVYRAYMPALDATMVAAATWEEVARMQPADLDASTYATAARCHNAGFVRTASGALAEPVVNASVANVVPGALYTYRFQPVAFERGEERYLDFTGQRPMNLRSFMGPKTKIAVDYRLLEIGPRLQQRVIGIKWHHGIYNNGSGNVTFQSCEGLTTTGDKKNAVFGKTDTRRHVGVIDVPAKRHVYVTGTTTNTASFTHPTSATTDHPIFLAGASNSADGETYVIPSSSAQTYNSKLRVYGVKIWEDGALMHDYAPARVDGLDGLQDAVDGVFLPAGRLADAGPNAVLGGYAEIVDQRGAGYVEADGHQGVVTDCLVTPRSRLEFDFATTEKQANTRLANAGQSGSGLYLDFYSSSSYGITFFSHDAQGSWADTQKLGTQSSALAMTTNLYVRRTYVVDWKGGAFRLLTAGYTNQTFALKTPVPTQTAAAPLKFIGGGNSSQLARGRFYGAKVYEDDVLVANYVPAVRDGVACVHDTVGGKYFFNTVPSGATAQPFGVGGRFACATDAFLESDGTQAISTGYHSTPDDRIEVDFMLNETNVQTRVFGVDGSASTAVSVFYIASGGTFAFVNNATWTGQVDSKIKGDKIRHTAIIDRLNDVYVLKTDGAEVHRKAFTTDHGNTSLWPIALFSGAMNADGTAFSPAERRARMKLFACRIYRNDALVHEFLPYKNGDVVGLYDTRTGVVKTNVLPDGSAFTIGGAGEFVERPSDASVGVNKSASFKVYAPGAIAYRWTLDGETVDGATTDSAVIPWRAQKGPSTLSVTPVFQLAGRQFEGPAATSAISFTPLGMLMTIR